jgi:hypothetical protein
VSVVSLCFFELLSLDVLFSFDGLFALCVLFALGVLFSFDGLFSLSSVVGVFGIDLVIVLFFFLVL